MSGSGYVPYMAGAREHAIRVNRIANWRASLPDFQVWVQAPEDAWAKPVYTGKHDECERKLAKIRAKGGVRAYIGSCDGY